MIVIVQLFTDSVDIQTNVKEDVGSKQHIEIHWPEKFILVHTIES